MCVTLDDKCNVQEGAEILVNDFAPSTGKMTLFFKQVTGKKSDGFAAIVGQTVFVIDSGRIEDQGVLEYMLSLRKAWLSDHPELLEDERAKLVIQLVITHAHSDHMPAVFHLVRHPYFRIEKVYAPPRAALADTDENPRLTQNENRFVALWEELQSNGHVNAEIIHLSFGDHQTISWGDNCLMELFAPPFDWSFGEARALIWKENEKFEDKLTYESNGILNNNSIWMKLTFNGQSVLFTGDQRDNTLAVDNMMQFHGLDNFKCDVLKYIHHGGRRYSKFLTDVTQSAVTVFTDVEKNIFPEALEAANHYGKGYSTEGGNLILELDGKNIMVR